MEGGRGTLPTWSDGRYDQMYCQTWNLTLSGIPASGGRITYTGDSGRHGKIAAGDDAAYKGDFGMTAADRHNSSSSFCFL